jgi:hypothetical protein
MSDFRKSIEASWRRYLRSAVHRSEMTPGQKAVTTVLLNMWLFHRNGPKGYINPGRGKIAKSCMVTEKTVSRTMALLRDAGALRVQRALRGEGGNKTEYTIHLPALMHLCGTVMPEIRDGELIEMSRRLWDTEL